MPKRNGIQFTLGLSVRRAREAKQRSQEKLAERAILDPTYIGGIERGLRNPDIGNIARPAKALGLTTSELCKRAGRMRGKRKGNPRRRLPLPHVTKFRTWLCVLTFGLKLS